MLGRMLCGGGCSRVRTVFLTLRLGVLGCKRLRRLRIRSPGYIPAEASPGPMTGSSGLLNRWVPAPGAKSQGRGASKRADVCFSLVARFAKKQRKG